MLAEHDQRFHRILNDYLERPAGDYAELLRRGYVSSPDGVDLEQCAPRSARTPAKTRSGSRPALTVRAR